jgi:hypothetical protein
VKQQSLASQAVFERYGRKSRRELFLDEMEQVVPWSGLQSLVEPHYAKAGNGRRPQASPLHQRLFSQRTSYPMEILRHFPPYPQ